MCCLSPWRQSALALSIINKVIIVSFTEPIPSYAFKAHMLSLEEYIGMLR